MLSESLEHGRRTRNNTQNEDASDERFFSYWELASTQEH